MTDLKIKELNDRLKEWKKRPESINASPPPLFFCP
jgi:hypothetical protein